MIVRAFIGQEDTQKFRKKYYQSENNDVGHSYKPTLAQVWIIALEVVARPMRPSNGWHHRARGALKEP